MSLTHFSSSGICRLCHSYSHIMKTIFLKNNILRKKPGRLYCSCVKNCSKIEALKKTSPKDLLEDATIPNNSLVDPDDVWSSTVYPVNVQSKQSQARHSARPSINPKETSIILFPGQGTHFVGMGKNLLNYPNVKKLYEVASDILGYDLLDLCLNGPIGRLDKTEFQQAAIVVTSLAALEKLKDVYPSAIENCVGTAGFSVGEITALTFAGCFSFEDAIKLVKVRGKAMQLASEMCSSSMYTVFYGPDSRMKFACSVAKEYCQQLGIEGVDCRIANYLFPHCKAIQFLIKNKEDFKIRKFKRLPVSGAFHTDLMFPVSEAIKEALQNIEISEPLLPVHSNLDGKKYKTAHHVKRQLPKQVYRPVKWEQTMHILYERPPGVLFPKTYECGPGRSLKAILKMINSKAEDSCTCIET